MTKIRHKTIICCLLAVVLTGNIIYQCVGCNSKSGGTQTEEKEDRLPRLNKILTNELSSRPETEGMDKDIERYMKRWELRGVQIAVSRNDSLVYAKGFGWADEERGEAMTPGHIMRIASVSKLLTAVGIMKLREQGRLKLSDHVFGANGILNDTLYTNAIRDKRHFDITVEQLLRHEAGFTNYAGDPMFSTRYIMMQNGLKTAPDHRTLLSIVLKRRLGYTPGTATRYCNIGYMLLSMIIEKCSGMSYEAYLQKYVLHPAHCFDFHIAGNYYKDRHPGEVRYYMHSDAEPIEEFNNSGRMVVKCYGENDLPRLQGAGAWVASAAELCRFVAGHRWRRPRAQRPLEGINRDHDQEPRRPPFRHRLESHDEGNALGADGHPVGHELTGHALPRWPMLGVHHEQQHLEGTGTGERHYGAICQTQSEIRRVAETAEGGFREQGLTAQSGQA